MVIKNSKSRLKNINNSIYVHSKFGSYSKLGESVRSAIIKQSPRKNAQNGPNFSIKTEFSLEISYLSILDNIFCATFTQ